MIVFAQIFVWLVYAHFAVGVCFLVWSWMGGLRKLDATAADGTRGFKLLIAPGLVALWPLLVGKALRGDGRPAVERNAHRDAARAEEERP